MKKMTSDNARKVRTEFEAFGIESATCATHAIATTTLEAANWLGYDLTPGQKTSVAAFAFQANQANKKNRNRPNASRFDRPTRGESMDDFNARQLTGKYDV